MAGYQVHQEWVFEANGEWYEFAATISNDDIGVVSLDMPHVVSFDFVNECNSLCLTGELMFVDTIGEVSKYLNRLYTHLQVGVIKCKKAVDNSGKETFMVDESYGRFSKFSHQFIIENFEIISRKENEVLYRLHLVSDEWYKLCGEFTFSNYDKSPGSSERKIFNILAECYNQLELSYNPESLKNRSDLELPYITNGNDNAFTATKYLMNRLYDSSDRLEDALKFIIYDPYNEKDLYLNCLDFEDQQTYLKAFNTQIIVSLYNTRFEQEFFWQKVNFATVLKKPMSNVYESMFVHNLWHLDDESKTFLNKKIDTTKLIDLQNKFDGVLNALGSSAKPKYTPLDIKWFTLADKYHHNSMTYNNDYSVYEDVIENLLDKDSLIVKCPGNFSHRPGAFMNVFLERSELQVDGVTKERIQEVEQTNKQLESIWLITKSRTHIRPAPPSEFEENLVLSRNYIIKQTGEQDHGSEVNPNAGGTVALPTINTTGSIPISESPVQTEPEQQTQQEQQTSQQPQQPQQVVNADQAIQQHVQTAAAPQEETEQKEIEVVKKSETPQSTVKYAVGGTDDLGFMEEPEPTNSQKKNMTFEETKKAATTKTDDLWKKVYTWLKKKGFVGKQSTLKKAIFKMAIKKTLSKAVKPVIDAAIKNGLLPDNLKRVLTDLDWEKTSEVLLEITDSLGEIPDEAWEDPKKYYEDEGRLPPWRDLKGQAEEYGLDTNNTFEDFDEETIDKEFNYIGSNAMPAVARYQLAKDHEYLLPAVLIHDMDYVKGGTEEEFHAANQRMKDNMTKCLEANRDKFTEEQYQNELKTIDNFYYAVETFGGIEYPFKETAQV